METQAIADILSKSSSIKEKLLGRELKNPKEEKILAYRRKLYGIFLKSIDPESRANLLKQDSIIDRIHNYYLVNGGWHITDRSIFSENSYRMQVTGANGEETIAYSFEMPRTEEGYVLQDYLIDSLNLSIIRGTEERFLQEHAEELAAIHQAFNAKKDILSNGKYSPLSADHEELVRAIEQFMGYNQPKEEVIKK